MVPGLFRISTTSARSEFRRVRHDAVHPETGRRHALGGGVGVRGIADRGGPASRSGGENQETDASISDCSVMTATSKSTSLNRNGEEALAREGRPLPTRSVAPRRVRRGWDEPPPLSQRGRGGERSLTRDSSRARSTCSAWGSSSTKTGVRPDASEPGYWHGRLDEISIFSRALEPDQIRQLHQSAAGPELDRPTLKGGDPGPRTGPAAGDNRSLVTISRLRGTQITQRGGSSCSNSVVARLRSVVLILTIGFASSLALTGCGSGGGGTAVEQAKQATKQPSRPWNTCESTLPSARARPRHNQKVHAKSP